MKKCNKCNDILTIGINWTIGRSNKKDYICKICIRDRKKKWRINNPESKKKSDKTYYNKNKKKIYDRVVKWKSKNKKQTDKYYKKYRKVYRENNRDKINNYAAKRRAYKGKAAIGNFKKELELIYKNCPKNYHVDHIMPLQGKDICGLHVPWNLQYLTKKENLSKGNKIVNIKPY
jgi:hypothetical protein